MPGGVQIPVGEVCEIRKAVMSKPSKMMAHFSTGGLEFGHWRGIQLPGGRTWVIMKLIHFRADIPSLSWRMVMLDLLLESNGLWVSFRGEKCLGYLEQSRQPYPPQVPL